MGKDPDAIYDEITRHRQQMTRHREEMQERVKDDIGRMRDRVKERSPADSVSKLADRVSAHPMSYLAGGFGTGVLLGALAPGMHHGDEQDRHDHANHRGHRDHRGEDHDGSRMAGILGMVSGPLMSSLDDSIRTLTSDVIAGFRGDDRSPEERDRAHQDGR